MQKNPCVCVDMYTMSRHIYCVYGDVFIYILKITYHFERFVRVQVIFLYCWLCGYMCVCIYICIYIHICSISVHIYIYVYVYIYIYIYIYMQHIWRVNHAYDVPTTYIYIHMILVFFVTCSKCERVFLCIYICKYIAYFLYVYLYAYYMHIHLYVFICIYICMFLYAYTFVCISLFFVICEKVHV